MSVQIHPEPANVRPGHRDPHAHAAHQPFEYPLTREYVEPDWTRLPGYRTSRPSSGSPRNGSAPTP